MAEDSAADRTVVLQAGRADHSYWRDVWAFRELFFVLAWRDVAARYKQTVIGVAWAVVRPLLTMVVFTFIFSRLAGLPSEGSAPYALMVFAGMLPWFLFSTVLVDAAQSVVASANMIQKIYYPRIVTPVASAVVAVVDFAVSLGVLALLMIYFQFVPGWQIMLLPVFTVMALAAALGPALLLAALNVRYRDIRFIIPFIVQFGLYVSPVGFSSSIVPESLRLIYHLNPMVAVIDGFRWCILGSQSAPDPAGLMTGLVVSGGLVWAGLTVFRRTEKSFADVI